MSNTCATRGRCSHPLDSNPVNDSLIIRGAREHNLKGVDLDLPRDTMIVFTGLSGSGKSSLAFDTIFAEGQRRYVESLSSYARQFLGQMDKPDVEHLVTGVDSRRLQPPPVQAGVPDVHAAQQQTPGQGGGAGEL